MCKIHPEYSVRFTQLYDIAFAEIQDPLQRLWTFHEQCQKPDSPISPSNSPPCHQVPRNNRNDTVTPTYESKKSLSLMPAIVKKHKITFSELETPKEVEKEPGLKEKVQSAQGFADLHTIVEECTALLGPDLDHKSDEKSSDSGDARPRVQLRGKAHLGGAARTPTDMRAGLDKSTHQS